MVNGWKLTAIIFIIISILQMSIMVLWWVVGMQIIEKENECSINICADADTYYYDYVEKICYCYKQHEIYKQVYIGGK